MNILETDACIKFIKVFLDNVSEEKITVSATLSIFKDSPELAAEILLFLNKNLKNRMRLLDLGCGCGYLTILVKNFLGFEEAYGVDIDEERLKESEKMGIKIHCIDLEKDPLPFPNNYFDMVVAAGILNHLKFWDNLLSEANRVLKPRGLLLTSDPNMGWWINRISLLLGYQPPNVEVSKTYTVNLPPFYPREKSIEYIHSLTLKGMIEILSLYNFKCLKVFSAGIPKRDLDLKKPSIPKAIKYLVRAIDYLMQRFPSLSLRLIIVSEKI